MTERAQRTRAQMARAVSQWKTAPSDVAKITEERRQLWRALNEYVTERGGSIVSPMYINPVRIETAPESELPTKLAELGYDVVHRREETRIGAPVSKPGRWGKPRDLNTGHSFHAVALYELTLPK